MLIATNIKNFIGKAPFLDKLIRVSIKGKGYKRT